MSVRSDVEDIRFSIGVLDGSLIKVTGPLCEKLAKHAIAKDVESPHAIAVRKITDKLVPLRTSLIKLRNDPLFWASVETVLNAIGEGEALGTPDAEEGDDAVDALQTDFNPPPQAA